MKLLKKQDVISNGVIDASEKLVEESFAVHRHDFFELEYIIEGSGDYTVNGVRYDIAPGKLFFLSPADIHSVQSDRIRLINVMFAGEVESEPLYRLIMQRSACEFYPQGEDGKLVALLAKETVAANSRGAVSDSLLFLNTLLCKLSTMRADAEVSYPSHIKKAIIYLLENFTSDITLEDTAKHIGISKNYLSELFHKEVSVSYKQYLDDLRFRYIVSLLRFSDISITEAYEKCGFDDYANFSRRFKLRYGCPPSEYRRSFSK